MQLLAQKLYKLTGKNKYIFWSVSSMVFPYDCVQPDDTILSLGEKMLKKAIDSNKNQIGAEEFELYINLLIKQNKFNDALHSLNELMAR